MTEEQQRIYNTEQDVIEAASNFIDAVCNLLNEVIEIVKEVIELIAEWYTSVYKQIKKYNCNNWRRVHGLPLIHRKAKCRQGRMFLKLL